MSLYNFKRLIDKYSVHFKLQKAADKETPTADDYDEQGNYKPQERPYLNAKGSLIPLPSKLIYESGGRLTSQDKTLYSRDNDIPLKSKVKYKGMVYHVEEKTPYDDYGDFSVYTLKAVKGVGEK